VGPREIPLRVHGQLLRESGAGFFRACLENFAEAESKTIRQADDDVESVEAFIEWLYGKPLVTTLSSPTVCAYAHMLLYADKICAEAWYNRCFDSLRQSLLQREQSMSFHSLLCIVDMGLESSALYKFALQSVAWGMMTDPSVLKKEDWPHPDGESPERRALILEDLLREIVEYKLEPYADPRTWTGCAFHHHTDTTCTANAQ
jgi:hypothetical protein